MTTARRKKFLKYTSFKWEITHLISLTLRKTPYGFLQTEFNGFTNLTILIVFFCHPHFLTIVLWMLPTLCSLNPSLSGWTRDGCIPGYLSSCTRYRLFAISTGLCSLAPLGSGSCLPCTLSPLTNMSHVHLFSFTCSTRQVSIPLEQWVSTLLMLRPLNPVAHAVATATTKLKFLLILHNWFCYFYEL